MARQTHCKKYRRGQSTHNIDLDPMQYFAVVKCGKLPAPSEDDYGAVRHGFAVTFNTSVFFFPAKEPAIAFGRAARMSFDCSSYGVYKAAIDTNFCEYHDVDECILLLAGDRIDRKSGEIDILKRFVKGVEQRPGSAGWHEPTDLGPSPSGERAHRHTPSSRPIRGGTCHLCS